MTKFVSNYTFSEFLNIAENGQPTTSKERSSRRPIENQDDSKFFNNTSFKDALKLVKFGWKDSFKMVELCKNLDKLIPVSQFKESFVYDVSGSYPDVGKYLTGEPENMVQFITEQDEKKISVIINGSVSWSIDQSIQFNKGAAMVSLVSKLEDLGYRVEVTLLYSSKTSCDNKFNYRHDTFIKIKEYHEQIDIDRFAFIFCNVAFNRRIEFSVNECSDYVNQIGYYRYGGYGNLCSVSMDFDIINSYDISLLRELVPETQDEFSTLEKSAHYVVQVINQYLEKQKERV